MNIVWGYNGTIIPLLPYSVFFSSDHILIEYLRTNNCLSFEKKLLASLMLKYDQCSAGQKWLRKSIGSIITGQPSQMLENVAKILSAKISESVVDVMRQLHAAGFDDCVHLSFPPCGVGFILSDSAVVRNRLDGNNAECCHRRQHPVPVANAKLETGNIGYWQHFHIGNIQ